MQADKQYDSYWKSGKHPGEEWDQARFQKYMGELKGRDRVLDYGCGLGLNYQRNLAENTGSYTGADVSDFALEDARSKGFSTLKINSDGSIAAEANSFDGATCVEVFEHLFDPLSAARELFRVLKPGGVLVATVPNFGYHAWRLMALLRARVPSEPENPAENRHNGVHIRYFGATTLKRLIQDAGFEFVALTSFDDSSIWDITRGLGPIAHVSDFARNNLPGIFHLRFLQDIWPGLFAYRIRVVARKP
jgi:SAM-dependent methyltransferase